MRVGASASFKTQEGGKLRERMCVCESVCVCVTKWPGKVAVSARYICNEPSLLGIVHRPLVLEEDQARVVERRKWETSLAAPKLVTTSDCKHQLAPDQHGRQGDHGTRTAWGGVELRMGETRSEDDVEVAVHRRAAPRTARCRARCYPEAPNWTHHPLDMLSNAE